MLSPPPERVGWVWTHHELTELNELNHELNGNALHQPCPLPWVFALVGWGRNDVWLGWLGCNGLQWAVLAIHCGGRGCANTPPCAHIGHNGLC